MINLNSLTDKLHFIENLGTTQAALADMQEINGYTHERNRAVLAVAILIQQCANEFATRPEQTNLTLKFHDEIGVDFFLENMQEAGLSLREVMEYNGPSPEYIRAETIVEQLISEAFKMKSTYSLKS